MTNRSPLFPPDGANRGDLLIVLVALVLLTGGQGEDALLMGVILLLSLLL